MEAMKKNPDNNDVVILELDRPRELRLGHKALKRFSALTECSMTDLEYEIQYYEKMTLLIWVMVTEEQIAMGEEMMSQEQLDALLDKLPLYKVTAAAANAIKAAFEDPDAESEPGDPPQAAAGTGIEA